MFAQRVMFEGRPHTALSHEIHGQITDIAIGGWNVEKKSLSPIQSYTRLKKELVLLNPHMISKATGRRYRRVLTGCEMVLDTIAAAYEHGLIDECTCYWRIFKDVRDWRRFAADLSAMKDIWMHERHYYVLDDFFVTNGSYSSVGDGLLLSFKINLARDENLGEASS